MRCTIYYKCKWADIRKIQQRFGITSCVDVNGESCQPVEVRDEDVELLRETERRGFIEIRIKNNK